DRWELENGAEYVAAGVGGPITGKRADLFIIDDPVKSHEEAESDVYRERNWEWFRSDVRTRMKPGCRIVLIQTRWHFDDLAGRILPENYDFRSGWITARDGRGVVRPLPPGLGRSPRRSARPEHRREHLAGVVKPADAGAGADQPRPAQLGQSVPAAADPGR